MGCFTDPTVGEKLTLWCEEAATQRHDWEQAICQLLDGHYCQRVVTPHICSKTLEESYSDWFGKSGFSFQKIEGKEDCENMVALPNKHLFHFAIYRHKPHSYRDLPIYYEISESYENGNLPAIFVTAFCSQNGGDHEYVDNLMKYINDNIINYDIYHGPVANKFKCVEVVRHSGLREELEFISKDNKKEPVFVYTLRLTFEWKE